LIEGVSLEIHVLGKYMALPLVLSAESRMTASKSEHALKGLIALLPSGSRDAHALE
jgi:hypothetical protein